MRWDVADNMKREIYMLYSSLINFRVCWGREINQILKFMNDNGCKIEDETIYNLMRIRKHTDKNE